MKIAFDFDGTITAHPQRMNLLAQMLQLAGTHVVVLTAAAGELPADQRPAEVAKRLLRYGFTCPHELACVEGHAKGEWCKANQVDVIIDDDAGYLERIRRDSPQTLRLKVEKMKPREPYGLAGLVHSPTVSQPRRFHERCIAPLPVHQDQSYRLIEEPEHQQ